jgi:plastocyanin
MRFCSSLLAALTLSATAIIPAFAETKTIVIKNFDFMPMSVSINAGDTVTWKNEDGEPHTVTSDTGLFRSGGLDQDDSFSFKFDKAGTYNYVCSIHPKMVGKIIVR